MRLATWLIAQSTSKGVRPMWKRLVMLAWLIVGLFIILCIWQLMLLGGILTVIGVILWFGIGVVLHLRRTHKPIGKLDSITMFLFGPLRAYGQITSWLNKFLKNPRRRPA